MDNKVVVTADQLGAVIGISSNNPEYGYIRLEHSTPIVDYNGWVRVQKRSALLKGKLADLQIIGYTAGQELDGKIVIRESLTPFNQNNPDRDLKVAGDSGVICRMDDQPIYRQSFYVTNPNATDELLQHTNTEEIRQVQAAQKTSVQSILNNKENTKQPVTL